MVWCVFTVDWFTGLRRSNIRPCVCVSLIEGFIQAAEKLRLFSVSRQTQVTQDRHVVVCCLWSDMCDHIIWPVFTPDTQEHSGSTAPKQHPTSQCLLTLPLFFSHSHVFCPSIPHHDTQTPSRLSCFISGRPVNPWCAAMIWNYASLFIYLFIFLPLLVHSVYSSTKVRGHRAGLRLSSWHREVRAARRSGAWGSVSSTCRNTTFNSCWRIALSSCAPPGQTGLWPSSGNTSRGWRRFVCVCFGFLYLKPSMLLSYKPAPISYIYIHFCIYII